MSKQLQVDLSRVNDLTKRFWELKDLELQSGPALFTPHVIQADFMESCFNNRESWAFSGNRAGKSEAGGNVIVSMATGEYPVHVYGGQRELGIHWRHRPGQKFWVCSESTEVQRDTVQLKILRWLPKKYIKKIIKEAKGALDQIILQDNTTIAFKNYEQDVDKFAGADVDAIWFDEEPPQDIYKECLMRTIDRGGHIFGTLTPVNGLTWIYTDIYEKAASRNIHIFQWDMDDNPFISEKVKAEVLAGLTEDEIKIRKSGQFVSLTGLIYPMYDHNKHFIKPFEIPKHWKCATATDPHLAKPISTVWMTRAEEQFQSYPKGSFFVYRELRKSGLASEIVDALLVYSGDENIGRRRLGDPALNIKSDNFDGVNVFDEYAKLGWSMLPANKEFFAGVQKVRELLGSTPPLLYVFNCCPGTDYEFRHYRLKDKDTDERKNYSERVLKRNDDFIDPVRYVIHTNVLRLIDRSKPEWAYIYNDRGRIIGVNQNAG